MSVTEAVARVDVDLPLDVEGLTPGFFAGVLDLPAGVDVVDANVDSIIWGTATKVFVDLAYSRPLTPAVAPARVCVKGGFNEELRPMAAPGYLAEARFFAELAPRLDVATPHCWFAGIDPDRGQGIVLLEDLRDSGTTFPSMVEPVSVDVVTAALEAQAAWHGATWDEAGLSDVEWLTLGSPVQRGIIKVMLEEEHWTHHLGLPRGQNVPPSMLARERIQAGFDALWSRDDTSTCVLSHGDAHVGNLFLTPDPAFLDWQGVCRAPWSDDVAYLIAGALSIEDRREHERDLLAHYLDALAETGTPAPDHDTAWQDYVHHLLHGFVWLLVPEAMQPEDVCAAMGERYAVACDDHAVLDALGA